MPSEANRKSQELSSLEEMAEKNMGVYPYTFMVIQGIQDLTRVVFSYDNETSLCRVP